MRLRTVSAGLAALFAAAEARGEPPVDVRAENVEIDAKTQELRLEGNVRVDSPPFHLRSDRLRVYRTKLGVKVDGPGQLAFCPCLGAPLAVRFDEATVAPPGDLLLKKPQLEIYGVPVLWLPYFWLRSAGRYGLLPPDLAYRADDGVYAGGGVHVPWRFGDEEHGIDLRAGAYLEGGAVVDARLVTPSSTTRVRWDRLRDDGLTIDARGATSSAGDARTGVVAWDFDAIRGARGVVSTTELDAAARPFDRAAAETSWRDGGWTFASGVRSTIARGGALDDFGAVGPIVTLRRGEAIGGVGTYEATVEGGALGDAGHTVSYARGEAGVLLAERAGPFGMSLAVRGAGDVAADAVHEGTSREGADGAATARARLTLPLVRAYASDESTDPWLHRVEPAIAASVFTTRGSEVLAASPGRAGAAIHGESWVTEAMLGSALGRWGARVGSEMQSALALVGPARDLGDAQLASRWRGSASGPLLGVGGELARVWTGPASGGAFVGRVRLGALDAIHLGFTFAQRDGVDPIVARALTDAPLEPSAGFLASEGWTGGARVSIPWTHYVITRAGAEADLTSRDLVAARASLELRDPCGCIAFRANGAQRIGRDGVDVWIAIDLVPSRP